MRIIFVSHSNLHAMDKYLNFYLYPNNIIYLVILNRNGIHNLGTNRVWNRANRLA